MAESSAGDGTRDERTPNSRHDLQTSSIGAAAAGFEAEGFAAGCPAFHGSVSGRPVPERRVTDRAGFEGAGVDGADAGEEVGVEGSDVERAEVEGAEVDGAEMQGAAIQGAEVEGAGIDGAGIDGAGIERPGLEGSVVETRGVVVSLGSESTVATNAVRTESSRAALKRAGEVAAKDRAALEAVPPVRRAVAPMPGGAASAAPPRGRRFVRAAARVAMLLSWVVAGSLGEVQPRDAGAASAPSARTVVVRQFSPQGEVAVVRQARATFSDAVVAFGSPDLPPPFDVRCSASGSGRWIDDRTWVYDFTADVEPGTRCNFDLKPGLRTRDGGAVTGKSAFTFATGGPAIVRLLPGEGSDDIDEEQVFVLVLSGAATPASVVANAWCEVSGIGERVGVRLVDGADRVELLKRFSLGAGAHDDKQSARVTTLACTRRLPNGAKVALVWGRGVASPSGMATTAERRLQFWVRPDFTASFGCERENAQAACTPVRPVRIEFTSPVPRDLAERFVVRFVDGGKTVERRPQIDREDHGASVSRIEFQPPFPESTALTVEKPTNLVDDGGRPLSNGSLFPLQSRTAQAPPLAKFAAAPFGILELNAEPVLPLTVRHVEAALAIHGVTVGGSGAAAAPAAAGAADGARAAPSQGLVRTVTLGAAQGDEVLIAWQRRIRRYHESTIPRAEVDPRDRPAVSPAIPPAGSGSSTGPGRSGARTPANIIAEEQQVQTRELSLLKRDPSARPLALPGPRSDDPRPFEVVGIPLPEPGFHIVEVESRRLGAALLGKPAPMYVRTSALVTDLGVHAKFGRVNAGVWVTSLDRARPVAGAAVQISDCGGKPLWSGVTDARGFAFAARAFPEADGSACPGDDDGTGESGYFVTARKAITEGSQAGRTDLAFVWSGWNQGIESWRFNLPMAGGGDGATSASEEGEPVGAPASSERLVAHTVFDRTLLRAGQTVSMKHLIRREDLAGLGMPATASLPTKAQITHVGSEQTFEFDLAWRGGRYAETTFPISQDAKLGTYTVALMRGDRRFETGSFRVAEFRLPLMRGRIEVAADGVGAPRDLVRPASVTAGVAISYSNGGSASALPVRLSAAIRPRYPQFTGYEGYSFVRSEGTDDGDAVVDESSEDGPHAVRGAPGQRVVADKVAVVLDKDGAGRTTLKDLPTIDGPRELLVEATYPDSNGEVQTLSRTVSLWPAALSVGVKTEDWVSVHGPTVVRLVVVDTAGKPVAGAPVELRGIARNVRSIRKRMVGGFYAYDNQRESKELGVLCSGKSNAQGQVFCTVKLAAPGNVELLASVKDAAGNTAESSTSVWVTQQADVWFGGENQDRIDVLPEKQSYAPGETARFQVRMPFRAATALVAIERDGILATQIVDIRGADPTIAVEVEADWAPNVFVSVLAVRGRIRDVPWYSFFQWGWRSPAEWWRAWREEGKLYEAPTALVDLGKPAFKYGIAAIQVDRSAHLLKVAVTTDKPDYAVRATARATVRVTLPDGRPAPAGTEVAVAAVDEALLELMPNRSWNLFDAMIRQRGYGVETSTAQMQIVGKRHYGRKAAPPGGGGGVSPSRELFDTLLLWKPAVVLDANGTAVVDVPLNDALTAFRIVAVADSGASLFGTGNTSFRSRQDLQIVAGLPPLVREGDRYVASVTVRNTTREAMEADVSAVLTHSAGGVDAASVAARPANVAAAASPPQAAPRVERLASRHVRLEADSAQRVEWPVVVPDDAASAAWRIDAKAASASDSIKVAQKVVATVPVTVQQATLAQLDHRFTMPVAMPNDALTDAGGTPRGGLSVSLRARLSDGMPGVRDWFARYPYACLEQKASIAIGTLDEAKWDEVTRQIPLYLDVDGLASYFPGRPDEGTAGGSDVLTAYLLSLSAEAGALGRYAIPDATRARMESGLVAFVEGRLKRDAWTPLASDVQRQLDVRKLAALEALSRHDKATPRMLQSIQVLPNQWPTSAVIDWMLVLKRLAGVPDRAARLAEADQILRARLDYQGTRLDFSTEKDDFWYWLMASADGNASRLLLAVLDDAAWKDDVPRLVTGLLQRQSRGHWSTTTANAWGTLAVNRFSKRFERDAVSGTTQAAIVGQAPKTLQWARSPQGERLSLSWPGKAGAAPAAGAELEVAHDGGGKPWLTVQSLAAVPLKAAFASGYRITRTVSVVEQKQKDRYSVGDVLRVRLDIDAQADMSWVVLSDPIPGGASVLGTGLGRDSQLATGGEKREGWTWPAYEEKTFEVYRSYYRFVPKGRFSTEYTVRLNSAGRFGMPPTRVEAMYAPEAFGALPNGAVEVSP